MPPDGSVVELDNEARTCFKCGAHAHAHLEDAVAGEQVTVQASPAGSLLKAQRGSAGALATARVLLRG